MSAHEYRLRAVFERTITFHDEDCDEEVTVEDMVMAVRAAPDDWAVSECIDGEMVEFSIEPVCAEDER